MKKRELLEMIRKILREVLTQRQNEDSGGGNVTANVDGYNTPYAFQKVPPRRKDKVKQWSHLSSSAYTEKAPEKKLFSEKYKNNFH